MLSEFGRYLILKKIAVGGMAEIFLARRVSIGQFSKFVVLKRLSPEYRGKRSFERLFLTEARLTGRLSHPNIVQVHDIGQVDGSYFMAMEYIHGVSSAELMSRAAQRRKPVPLGVALSIVRATARALAYCGQSLSHEGEGLDLLHHDVSPHNIQVRFDGEVKLLDFGVATQSEHQEGSGRRGKFAYMSPEAFARKELDQLSDLFSLGVVLYELTMGRRLFKGKTQQETKERAERCEIPPPRSIHAQFPERLETLILKALNPSKDERYQSFESLISDIDLVRDELSIDCSSERVARYLTELYEDEIERRMHHLQSLAARAELIGADSLDEINTLHPREKPPINLTGKGIGQLPTEQELESLKISSQFSGVGAIFEEEEIDEELLESIIEEVTPSGVDTSMSSPIPPFTSARKVQRGKSRWQLWAVALLISSAGAFWFGQQSPREAGVESTLTIRSQPAQATILVNGEKVGETSAEATTIKLTQQSTPVTVQVQKIGFKPRSTRLDVSEGRDFFLEFDLASKTH